MAQDTRLDSFTRAYVEAALWSSTDDFVECGACRQLADENNGQACPECGELDWKERSEPLDANYSVSDIADETLVRMVQDCQDFQDSQGETLERWYGETGETMERAGHDFWLTRNRHGAGYWDRWNGGAEGKIGQTLTDAAHTFGEFNLYVGDDGRVYGS
jgi:hypothetical protein